MLKNQFAVLHAKYTANNKNASIYNSIKLLT